MCTRQHMRNHSPYSIICLPTMFKSEPQQRKRIWYLWPSDWMELLFPDPSLATVFQLLWARSSSQSRGRKKHSTSLFERWTVHVKSWGTYVFAVTSTNCPGRKCAAYKGVPSKEEERPCSTNCWNPQTTPQSLPSRTITVTGKETKLWFYSHIICSSL